MCWPVCLLLLFIDGLAAAPIRSFALDIETLTEDPAALTQENEDSEFTGKKDESIAEETCAEKTRMKDGIIAEQDGIIRQLRQECQKSMVAGTIFQDTDIVSPDHPMMPPASLKTSTFMVGAPPVGRRAAVTASDETSLKSNLNSYTTIEFGADITLTWLILIESGQQGLALDGMGLYKLDGGRVDGAGGVQCLGTAGGNPQVTLRDLTITNCFRTGSGVSFATGAAFILSDGIFTLIRCSVVQNEVA